MAGANSWRVAEYSKSNCTCHTAAGTTDMKQQCHTLHRPAVLHAGCKRQNGSLHLSMPALSSSMLLMRVLRHTYGLHAADTARQDTRNRKQ
jgi:hypothetical protein